MSIYTELKQERKHQDKKWGGPLHDDTHDEDDWEAFIHERLLGVPRFDGGLAHDPYRHRMIEIAALAIAAIESYDRKHK